MENDLVKTSATLAKALLLLALTSCSDAGPWGAEREGAMLATCDAQGYTPEHCDCIVRRLQYLSPSFENYQEKRAAYLEQGLDVYEMTVEHCAEALS